MHAVSKSTFPDFDHGAFRWTVARYVKLLIRTRWKDTPGFLNESDLNRWGLQNIGDDTQPAWRLAAMAADAMAILNREYLQLCGSGGVPVHDDAVENTPIGRLAYNVYDLVMPDGGGPYHVQTLLEVVKCLKARQPINWRETVNWDLLKAIRDDLDCLPDPVRPSPRLENTNLFRRNGSDWTVSYRGFGVFPLKNGPGPMYIHSLLQRPGQDIAAETLAAVWDGFNVDKTHSCSAGEDRLALNGMRNCGEVLDRQARRECAAEYQDLTRELDDAKENNDVGRIAKLQAELHMLAETVSKATRPGGKSVFLGDKKQKLVDRVSRAIRRTIDAIKTKDSGLGIHLESFISTGAECKYAPEPPAAWNT